jgi:tetratricopeptide (TPR) repeat protein
MSNPDKTIDWQRVKPDVQKVNLKLSLPRELYNQLKFRSGFDSGLMSATVEEALASFLVNADESEASDDQKNRQIYTCEDYDKLIEINPNDYKAWYGRGVVLKNLGSYEEAIASLDKVLEIKPDYYKAWYARGNALYGLDFYEEAIASYNKVIELKPDYHKAWYYRGKALDELGLHEEASASYRKAQEIQQMKQHYSSQEEYEPNQVNEYVRPTPHLLLPEAWQPSQPYKAGGTFSEFLSSPDALRMHLKLGDASMAGSPVVTVQNKGTQDLVPQQSYLIELHPVFSHISFLLIQSLSETGHGEFITRSKQGKFETIVELGGHVSQRYLLSKQELDEIQQIYDQILDTWIAWRRLSQKKAYQSFRLLLLAVAQSSSEDIVLNQSSFIELHPVFSHISFLLIQSLSETGHGEFITRSKQGKFETIVELGGHVSQRYLLSKQELDEIQQIYDQIVENWIRWRQFRKKN